MVHNYFKNMYHLSLKVKYFLRMDRAVWETEYEWN